MSAKQLFVAAIAVLGFSLGVKAQTNVQFFYDLGKDRHHLTTTVEGFYNDKWGNTFFFIDHDFNSKTDKNHTYAPSGTYLEIARCLNFWQDTRLAPLSAHVEYNGGVYNGYTINNAFLFGVDYFIHSADFKNTLNLKALYKYIDYSGAGKNMDGSRKSSDLPLQFTVVWGLRDLFGAKGLVFSGFMDFWWEDHAVAKVISDKFQGYRDMTTWKDSKFVFLSEPQLWYNVGQHFGVDNLNVGTEVELSCNFGTGRGFCARPCLGLKWVF